jgi:hypothetical protein
LLLGYAKHGEELSLVEGDLSEVGLDARIIAVGRSPHGPVVQFAEGSFTNAVTHAAARTVVLVEPGKPPYQLAA